MNFCRLILLLCVALLLGGKSWSAPDIFMEALEKTHSLEEWQSQTERFKIWKKLTFLCEGGENHSFNPRCYELAKLESAKWKESLSGHFPSWWEKKCADDLSLLNWQELMRVQWKELPPGCQKAWTRRQQELVYRFSGDDVEFLWRQRHR